MFQLGTLSHQESTKECAGLCARNANCYSYRFLPVTRDCLAHKGNFLLQMFHPVMNAHLPFVEAMVRPRVLLEGEGEGAVFIKCTDCGRAEVCF